MKTLFLVLTLAVLSGCDDPNGFLGIGKAKPDGKDDANRAYFCRSDDGKGPWKHAGNGTVHDYNLDLVDEDHWYSHHKSICLQEGVETLHWYSAKPFKLFVTPVTLTAKCPTQPFQLQPVAADDDGCAREVNSTVISTNTRTCGYDVGWISCGNNVSGDPHIISKGKGPGP